MQQILRFTGITLTAVAVAAAVLFSCTQQAEEAKVTMRPSFIHEEIHEA